MSFPHHPISDKQRAANRANAQRSTGPRTPEGKARSAQNARKHGFTASTFAVVRLEALDELAHLKDDLMAVYQPVNSQELFAIERIALTQQTLLRAARLEAGLFTSALSLTLSGEEPFITMSAELAGNGDIEITRAQNRNFALGESFHRLARRSNCWALFLRYQAQAERMYRRAVEEFERLKRLRNEFPNEPIGKPEPEENKAALDPETDPFPAPEAAPEAPPAPETATLETGAARAPVADVGVLSKPRPQADDNSHRHGAFALRPSALPSAQGHSRKLRRGAGLPGSSGPPLPLLMDPQAQTAQDRFDSLDPETFAYQIKTREIRAA